MRVHEAQPDPPLFELSSPASLDTVLNLHLALAQNDLEGLQGTLFNISNPSSASYGQWLSKEEVHAITRDL